jgi:hypothetical protein
MPVGMEPAAGQPKEATAAGAAGQPEITEQLMEKLRWTKE